MTTEEAIEFGNMWLQINEDCKDSNTYTFFHRAIKVIEQEPILDKIKAEIEELEEDITSYHNDRPWIYKDEVLAIIDKYKAESEDK